MAVLQDDRKPDARSGRSASTIDRIVIAAERLFGTFGIEAVSLRQIIIESGAGNNSAIAYHFGDRAGLIREIWRRRLPDLEIARAKRLDEVVRNGGAQDPHALAQVLLLPAYDCVDQNGLHPYAAFLRQSLRSQTGHRLRLDAMGLSPSSDQAYGMFRNVFSEVPDELFTWRSLAATGLFLDLVVDRDRSQSSGDAVMDEGEFLEEAIRLVVACCRA